MIPYEVTTVNAFTLSFSLALSLLTFVLPRRFAIGPILVAAFYLSAYQRLSVADIPLTMLRIVILAALARVIVRKEFFGVRLILLDKLMILWVVVSFIAHSLLWKTSPEILNRVAFGYHALGLYFIVRCLVRDRESIILTLVAFALVTIPLALSMLIESSTGLNYFSIFGGVPRSTLIRDDRLRCQGPFAHPILAGTFGATLIPFFVVLWRERGGRRLIGLAGLVSSTIITITSSSSGPLASYVLCVIALLAWTLRRRIRAVRWAIVLGVVSLHAVMKAPVWYVIDRLSDVIGGTGDHRSEIINQAINRIGEWWLLGTTYTAHWMPVVLPDYPHMADITSQYVWEGVNGGLGTLSLFVSIIVIAFRDLGRAIKRFRDQASRDEFMLWAIGAALFSHAVSFLGVAYFDQLISIFYVLIGIVAGASLLEPQNYIRKKTPTFEPVGDRRLIGSG